MPAKPQRSAWRSGKSNEADLSFLLALEVDNGDDDKAKQVETEYDT